MPHRAEGFGLVGARGKPFRGQRVARIGSGSRQAIHGQRLGMGKRQQTQIDIAFERQELVIEFDVGIVEFSHAMQG